MKSNIIKCFFLLIVVCKANGQTIDSLKTREAATMEERFLALKDSLTQVQQLIPAVSAVIINQKEIEINFFNSFLTANSFRSREGGLENWPFRQTYFYNGIQLTYGVSKDNFNVGLDINTSAARVDFNRENSPFLIFSHNPVTNSSIGPTITSIGPRIRWRPFKNNYRFTMQGSVMFPVYGDSERENLLGLQQTIANAHFFYHLPLTKRIFLFTQVGLQHAFENEQSPGIFFMPFTGYLGYLITPKVAIFTLGNHLQMLSNERLFENGHSTQWGLGAQYQFSRKFLLNGFYAQEIAGKNYGAFQTLALSMRFLIY